MKSIGVGGSVLSICTEFLSDRRQRVVVDGAALERLPIISGVHREVCLVLLFRRCVWPPLTGTWLGFRSGALIGA